MINLSWRDVYDRANKIAESCPGLTDPNRYKYVYGVPRGGIIPAVIVASMIDAEVVESLEELTCRDTLIVDDVVDSGTTRMFYRQYTFVSLVDKQKERLTDWILFPWERMNKETSVEDSIVRIQQYLKESPRAIHGIILKLYGGRQ